jgi:tetratricopeptide (TPR) repeat protein
MSQLKVFLSSRMAVPALKSLREELYRERIKGSAVWVPELELAEMKGIPLDAAEAGCLREIRASQGFVCVLDGSYGADQWDVTEISILEVEIFLAALSQLPMAIFLLEPFRPDPRIAQLLAIVKAACPQALFSEPRPRDRVRSDVLRFCDRIASPWSRSLGRLVDALARRRSPAFRPGTLDVRFLDGPFAAPAWGRFDPDLVTLLMARADDRAETHAKLVDLWKAVRCLAAVPYRDGRFREHLPLWDAVLARWASASSWYGLHGHLFIGRLAAVNALIEIRSTGVPAGEAALAIQGTYGALASEYHSIAKNAGSLLSKRRLLRRGVELVDLALDEQQADPSGLLNIRGALHLALWRGDAAVRDYERALAIRRDRGSEPGGIGECEVDLGLAYLRTGRLRRAEALLETGVERLRREVPSGFTVRALRKLSVFYFATLRWRESREVLAEAWRMAVALGLQDQMSQIRRMPGGRSLGIPSA